MKHSARISQRTVKFINRVSRQAQTNISMQLAYMQCERLGHIPGKVLSDVGAYHRTIRVCKRCMRVIDDKGSDVIEIRESEKELENAKA